MGAPAPAELNSTPRRRGARAALAFLAGILSAGALLIPRLYPAETYAAWCRWRYGAEPSEAGVVLTLRAAPSEVRGSQPAPWVLLEFRNVGEGPTTIYLPERPGEELSVRELDGRAEPVLPSPDRVSVAVPLHPVELPPGGSLAQPCSLAPWLRFPEPGRYRVEVERAPLAGDRHRFRSNVLELDVTP